MAVATTSVTDAAMPLRSCFDAEASILREEGSTPFAVNAADMDEMNVELLLLVLNEENSSATSDDTNVAENDIAAAPEAPSDAEATSKPFVARFSLTVNATDTLDVRRPRREGE